MKGPEVSIPLIKDWVLYIGFYKNNQTDTPPPCTHVCHTFEISLYKVDKYDPNVVDNFDDLKYI